MGRLDRAPRHDRPLSGCHSMPLNRTELQDIIKSGREDPEIDIQIRAAALLELLQVTQFKDLKQRGLLDSTLVVMAGEFGRTPKINPAGGRDHWPQCGFCLLFGGGIKKGLVYGTTDKNAGYPKDMPVTQGDITATIYHLLGVDPESTVPDQTGRPIHISHGGRVVEGLLA